MSKKDYTNSGIKQEGQWENDRNAESRSLFMAMIREAFGVSDVIVAHHLVYSQQDGDQFLVEEIPSADTLIFDHDVMRKLFPDSWERVIVHCALTPPEARDECLALHFYNRAQEETQPSFMAQYGSVEDLTSWESEGGAMADKYAGEVPTH